MDLLISDILVVFSAYLVLLVIQLIVLPFTYRFFGGAMDSGWSSAKLFGTLLIALAVWLLAYLGTPINTDIGVGCVLIGLIAINLLLIWRSKPLNIFGKASDAYKWIVAEEVLFIVGFFGLSLIRGFHPDILDLEKFMDYGFVKSYLSSPTLPAKDMWFAGSSINYYSFGHFWTSIVIRLWGVSGGVGFNLMLSYLCGLSLSLSFSIISNLIRAISEKARFWQVLFAGVVGSALVTVGGNSQLLWYLLTKKTLDGYWYPDATRFIDHTIHEFPGYSFVVSDLHAHVLGLPLVLSYILLLLFWSKNFSKIKSIGLGCLLGMMMMTNTWDVLIYGLLTLIFGWLIIFRENRKLVLVVKSGVLIGVGVVVVAALWWLRFVPISSSLGVVTDRTPLWQLGALWGGQLFICLVALIIYWQQRKDQVTILAVALIISAVLLLFIPEFLYVKDIYTTYPRANTMFKLTYQAFVLMSLTGGVAIGIAISKKRILAVICLLFLSGGLLAYPAEAFPTYYNNFSQYRGLDGLAWHRKELTEQAVISNFLEENRDGKNMVEAVGDSYTKFNAISAFSGTPTIIGWKVHEWLWRGGYDPIAGRAGEVSDIYQSGDLDKVRMILDKYQVGWIVVGKNERETYKLNETNIKKLGEIVVKSGNSYLIQVR